jgi:alcohol dehydrogenase
MTEKKININFALPTRIVFGSGSVDALSEEVQRLKGRRILLVCDPGLVSVGLTDRIVSILDKADVHVEVFSGVSANPRDAECLAGVDHAELFGADVLVGLGGGSPMDAAKAIGVLLANGGRPQDWADGRQSISKRSIPLICIPTTAGTGSEVTPVAVITDSEKRLKIGLLGSTVAPDLALVDPELTHGLPADTTAATGMDAFTHAIEAYTCRQAHPISDALALAAIEKISQYLPAAYRNGSDETAREQMLLGALLAGIAFGQADVGAVHCLAESLGGLYDIPHGMANALFLPHVMAFNARRDVGRHAIIGRAIDKRLAMVSDEMAAREGVRAICRIKNEIGLPSMKAVIQLSDEELHHLAALAAEHPCSASNSRPVDAGGYFKLLSEAYEDRSPIPL